MVAGRDQRAIDDPRFASVPWGGVRIEPGEPGVIVETMRCAADFEIAKHAASSRIVRLVRNAAHASKTRCASEHDHRRPRRGSGGRRWITAASRRWVMAASASKRAFVIVDVMEEV